MERYICIHGHFYQPPRENPWLEAIEIQDSAYPYHNWNERITAECYEPNATSRILNADGDITRIVNNYSRISFNFGPTLLAWMEPNDPSVYEAILEADRESRERFSGHGSAPAQAYNHMIMPLANRRDKVTQVQWGLRDFEHRFGRKPEGMWLAETAVDLETLEVLAECGVRFTVLSPYQAGQIRKRGGRKWHEVTGGHIDPTMPYEQRLPSGRRITLFFYDGPISRAIAFERLLVRGEDFAQRLLAAFSDKRDWPQIVHIATDGETYGHHHKRGDMALAYALHCIEQEPSVRLTNFGEYLEKHPPRNFVQIIENTAWSCVHGIDRWRKHCGCNSGGHPEWNQHWRGPLRAALDWLRDTLAPKFEEHAGKLVKAPWAARNDYISVVLDRSPESVEPFFARHQARLLSDSEKIRVLKLLELQRHAMLMYTSCGWFFDELSGIETVQVIQYAGRALQLAEEMFGDQLEFEFLNRLELAKSNLSEHQDGRRIYEKWVKPTQVDIAKVAAHFAASSLFEEYEEHTRVYCYRIDRKDEHRWESGRARATAGYCDVTSRITGESDQLDYACVHLGDHNLIGGVRKYADTTSHALMVQDLQEAFLRADFPETIRRVDRHLAGMTFSLSTLFRDEQRRILNTILDSTLERAEGVYRQLYEENAPLTKFLSELGTPMPAAVRSAAELILNVDLRRALLAPDLDPARVRALLGDAEKWQAQLDTAGLAYLSQQTVERMAVALRDSPRDLAKILELADAVDMARSFPFEVDLSKAQNLYYELLNGQCAMPGPPAALNPAATETWIDAFRELGKKLSVCVKT